VLILTWTYQLRAQKTAAQIRADLEKSPFYLSDGGGSFIAQPNLFKEIDMSSYELLSGSLSFSDKDQTQKIVMSPFKLLNNTKQIGSLVNTKINITLKDKITTIGLGLAFDNSSFFSNRAVRLRKRFFCDGCFKTDPGTPDPIPDNADIFMQKLLARLLDSASVKGVIDAELIAALRNANKNTIDSLEELYGPEKLKLTGEKFLKEKVAPMNKEFDSLLLAYDKALAKNVFKASVGYNIQLFPNLFSQGSANDFDSLNYHNLKSHNISGSITYSHCNNWLVIVANYNQIFALTTAEKKQIKVPYYGPALSVNLRVATFVDQNVLDKMPAYKKSLFVPSLNLGLSFEGKYADGAQKYTDYYQDKTKKIVTWMPYADLLFTPALQFRIGLPITRMHLVTGEKQSFVGANIQYNIKISNLAL
jgi:hypothetical protein